MKMMHLLAAATVTALLAFGTAQATVIDFGALPQGEWPHFAGQYLEEGYTVSAVDGRVWENHLLGNSTPNLVVGPLFHDIFFDASSNGAVEVSFGGLPFTLDSFDLLSAFGPGDYVVTGWLGGSPVFTLSGSAGPSLGDFTTISGAPGAIDTVDFALTAHGMLMNLDNIVVNAAPVSPPAVPEPGSLVLAGVALGGLALAASRG